MEKIFFRKKLFFYFLPFYFFISCKTTQVSLAKRTLAHLPIDNKHKATFFDERIKFLILHYTQAGLKSSLKTLIGTYPSFVSAHYLISDSQKKIYHLLNEDKRAWHAGSSNWESRTNLNDSSIGIEIVNLGYKDTLNGKTWYPFNENQIQSIIRLSKDIIKRYNIKPNYVLGHSDIAPGRKVDPGPLFPWEKLAKEGIGAWYDKEEVEKKILELKESEIDLGALQKDLKSYGYKIEETGELDEQTKNVLSAFQMHFRPSDYSGKIDAETIAILQNLLQKYIN